MTLDDAKTAIVRGTPFGDVFPLVPADDHGALRNWFVRAEHVRRRVVKNHTIMPAERTPKEFARPTGNTCPKCGGANTTRTGTCETCLDCGESLGGCS